MFEPGPSKGNSERNTELGHVVECVHDGPGILVVVPPLVEKHEWVCRGVQVPGFEVGEFDSHWEH